MSLDLLPYYLNFTPKFLVNIFGIHRTPLLTYLGLTYDYLHGRYDDWLVLKTFEWGELGWDYEEGFRFQILQTQEAVDKCKEWIDKFLEDVNYSTRECHIHISSNVYPVSDHVMDILQDCKSKYKWEK